MSQKTQEKPYPPPLLGSDELVSRAFNLIDDAEKNGKRGLIFARIDAAAVQAIHVGNLCARLDRIAVAAERIAAAAEVIAESVQVGAEQGPGPAQGPRS